MPEAENTTRAGKLKRSDKNAAAQTGSPIEVVASPVDAAELPARDQITILIIGSNPDGTGRLRLDREARAIREELEERAKHRDGFHVEMRPALRVQELQRTLRDVQPDILHFGGHGERNGILVEGADGRAHPISIDALSRTMALHKRYLRCVVLNACYSEAQARAIAAHIPCVVGMSSAIRDDAAIAFAREFYTAIGAGDSVGHAFRAGRLQIELENLADEDKPQLKTSVNADKERFAPRPTAKPLRPRLPFEPETIPISAGTFIMGDDDNPAASPQHTVDLPAYRIGRYPVTNAQYAAFIADERDHPAPPGWFNRQAPHGRDDHPITQVNWYDALAYCRWLSDRTDRAYTLPSEAEWEKAAAHAPDNPNAAWRYPWGDRWDAARCNHDSDATTPVKAYDDAGGGSAYGVYDLLGNVQEWTRSQWGASPLEAAYGYPYDPSDRREVREPDQLPTQARLVVRGGHYRRRAQQLYNCTRGQAAPSSRVDWRGFRVANMTTGAQP